jgi:ABC-type Mn2+/Zn2+ transport system permease subunit
MPDFLIEPLSHGTSIRALAEISVLGVVSGVIGCWIVLFELSYSAESLAHGMFPGLVAAALIGAPLLLGGAAGVLLAALMIVAASRFSGESGDTAIAVVITTLFGAGALLALSPESPAGLQELLFGDLLGTTFVDVAIAAAIGTGLLALLWLLHDRLLAVGFDRGAASVLGIPAGRLHVILLALVAVTILVAVQGLGNLLVAAILVGPAAAARQLTRRVGSMMLLSAGVAIAAGFVGIYASYHLKTAAGASVVIAILALYALAAGAGALRGRPGTAPG